MKFNSISMSPRHTHLAQAMVMVALAASFQTAMAATATAPAQKPLLTTVSGAKPNLMITVDNSGSMAFTYPDSYNVTSNAEYEAHYCPSPYSNSSSTNSTTSANGIGGEAAYDSSTKTYSCYLREWVNGNWRATVKTAVSLAYSPSKYYANWSAQRSAEVNPIYYNPRTTYLARVDSQGTAIVPTDGLLFVSNQESGNFQYTVYRDSITNTIKTYHSINPNETNAATTGNNERNPTGFTSVYNLNYSKQIPNHIAYPNPKTFPVTAAPDTNTPPFTYAICNAVTTNASGLQTGCTNATKVNVYYGGTASITLPADHSRTDCTGGVCTNAQEVANILNWYRYYSTRTKASATAIGQALANSDFYKNIRLGYMNINRRSNSSALAMDLDPGSSTADLSTVRGVRLHTLGGADTNQFYTWLYGHLVMGGTPLHNSIDRVANYYTQVSGVSENPWATNPTSAISSSNPEMTCRRSFNLLFSDGAWNSGTSTNAGSNADATDEPSPGFQRASDGGYFRYLFQGENTLTKRFAYTPYPGVAATGGLSDLTANYFWHTDMRPALGNAIQTTPGQPSFWQNMATYTVGYMIQPSGEATGATSGLTFSQIDQYKTQYLTNGYTSATKPSWTTANVNSSTVSDDERVDDFIQSGFTGGGKGYSAQTADDVRRIFSLIVSDVLGASGNDAGVSVSSNGSDSSTIAGRLKYGVTYKTLDNSGDITAYTLDTNGKVLKDASGNATVAWVASNHIPSYNLRNVYTMSGTNSPIDFTGRFDGLAADVRATLKQGSDAARIANDESFVNYLLGNDPVTDANGKLFRVRSSKYGAMVNPPSIYMGGQLDATYDLHGDITGASSYRQFTDRKRGYPASLFVATNAGIMHALNATTGVELSAFMPRRSLKRMLHYADEAYTFEYTLDGPLSQHDVYDTGMVAPDADWKRWKHIGIGTGGRGEQLIYAVNSPFNQGSSFGIAANRIPGRTNFLWESGPDIIDSSDSTDLLKMGYLSNALPLAGQTLYRDSTNADLGQWIVVANSGHYNGYESTGKRAGLVVLNPSTGAVIKRLPLPAGADAGRGLSGVTILRDTDGTNRIVGAYAGDAKGNLWKFNIQGAPSTWGVAYNGTPLFTTPNNRPIYGAPAWQPHPNGGYIVVVATGMMLEDSDLKDTSVNESIYGIWDPTSIGKTETSPFTKVSASELLEQSVTTSTATPGLNSYSANTFYQTSKNVIDWKIDGKGTHRGWHLPLGYISTGERSIAEVQNLRTSVLITTTVLTPPVDSEAEICAASTLPPNYVYVLNALDGQHTRGLDINDDATLEDYAVAYLPNGGYSRGVSVVRPISNTDPILVDPSDPNTLLAGSLVDPKSALSDTARETNRINEAGGESITQKCIGNDVRNAQGAVSDGLWVGVSCPNTGWNRTQYQLSSPPTK